MSKTKFVGSRNPRQKPMYFTEKGERVLQPGTGARADAEKRALQQQVAGWEQKAMGAEQRIKALEATLQVLKKSLEEARQEADNARSANAAPDMPAHVAVLTIDDIARTEDRAALQCCAEIDGHVGDTTVSLPIETLREVLRRKVAK